MQILIIDNFFSPFYSYLPKFIIKLLLKYKKFKLKALINKLRKTYGKDIKIEFIIDTQEKFEIKENISINYLSDFRIDLDRTEFLKLKNKIKNNTKELFIKFINNLNNLRTFHFQGISIGNLLELNMTEYFKTILGKIELLRLLIHNSNYDKIILFNYSKSSLETLHLLNLDYIKIEMYRDPFRRRLSKFLIFLNFFTYFLIRLAGSIKIYINKKFPNEDAFRKNEKKNIMFIANTKNHFNSINPIYLKLKQYKSVKAFYYSNKNFFPKKHLNKEVKFLIQKRRIWKDNEDKILNNLNYNGFTLKFFMKNFYDMMLFYILIEIFNNFTHFNQIIKVSSPNFVVSADEMKIEGKGYAKICRMNNIPIIYVPHAGTPIYDEFICKRDFTYIIVGGESGLEYYKKKGEPKDKIKITGYPRYDNFYKGEIKQLYKINDMFNNSKYKFEKDKFKILFTSSPIGRKFLTRIITTIIYSLKELNLDKNLIIKLHPREDGILHKKILQDLNSNAIIVKDVNILELIKSCDLLLTTLSTTILEAMIIGTPVILLDFLNRRFQYTGRYSFSDEVFIKVAKSLESLKKLMKELYTNKEFYKNYSKEIMKSSHLFNFYDENEPPTEKIIKLILKQC